MFTDDKEIYVSSVVYNLAGPEDEKDNFLKTATIGAVLSSDKRSISESVTEAYLRGPAISMRTFGQWARTSGYNAAIGQATATLYLPVALDYEALAAAIPKLPGETVEVQIATISTANYLRWAERYMLENYPEEVGTNYAVDLNEFTDEITITRVDTSTVSFIATDFDLDAQYLYVNYLVTTAEEIGSLVPGSEVVLPTGDPFPSTTGWTINSYSDTESDTTLTTTVETVHTFSDARPDESSTSTSTATVTSNTIAAEYERTTYQGLNPSLARTTSLREVRTDNQTPEIVVDVDVSVTTETIAGGVIKTTTVTTTTESRVYRRAYQIDSQVIVHKRWNDSRILIYRRYSGSPAYDVLFRSTTDVGSFYPFIPIRLWNSFLTEALNADLYVRSRKALRKSIRADFSSLVQQVAANPSLGDIDHAYVVFGVSLNTKNNSAKRYIYEFFQEIMLGQDLSGTPYQNWRDEMILAQSQAEDWIEWADSQVGYIPENPLWGTPAPPQPSFPLLPRYEVRIWGNSLGYGNEIYWAGISESFGSGLKIPTAKPGDVWFENGGTENYFRTIWTSTEGAMFVYETDNIPIEKTLIHWQVSENEWRTLEIYGLSHHNYVYGGKFVNTTAHEALASTEESGFIIPLQETLYKRTPIKHATQMALASAYMVFNCYKEVRTRWYDSLGFRVILMVVLITAAWSFGFIGPSSVGLLGTNASVGAAMGFVGSTAVLAGALANMVAAMVVGMLINTASTAIFGEKVGTIIGAIATFLVATMGGELIHGGDLITKFSDPKTLISLSVAVGDSYSSVMKIEAAEYQKKAQGVLQDFAAQSARIREQTLAEFGSGNPIINPLEFVEASPVGPLESPEAFLSRTLMTGSDIAEISLNLVSEFSEVTLSTKLPV